MTNRYGQSDPISKLIVWLERMHLDQSFAVSYPSRL